MRAVFHVAHSYGLLFFNRDGNGRVTEVFAKLNLGNTDFKKTLKLTWLAKDEAQLTPISVVYYDHIITKPVLAKDEDFKQYINKESKKVRRFRRLVFFLMTFLGCFLCR